MGRIFISASPALQEHASPTRKTSPSATVELSSVPRPNGEVPENKPTTQDTRSTSDVQCDATIPKKPSPQPCTLGEVKVSMHGDSSTSSLSSRNRLRQKLHTKLAQLRDVRRNRRCACVSRLQLTTMLCIAMVGILVVSYVQWSHQRNHIKLLREGLSSCSPQYVDDAGTAANASVPCSIVNVHGMCMCSLAQCHGKEPMRAGCTCEGRDQIPCSGANVAEWDAYCDLPLQEHENCTKCSWSSASQILSGTLGSVLLPLIRNCFGRKKKQQNNNEDEEDNFVEEILSSLKG